MYCPRALLCNSNLAVNNILSMGCLSSKPEVKKEDKMIPKTYSWDRNRENFNPEDFKCSKRKGEVIIKEPG